MTDKLDEFIDRAPNLPASPRVLVRLIEVFRDGEQDLVEIANIFTQDASLTTEVLKRSNSAYFAGAEPVGDVFEAGSRLGLNEIYKLVLALFASAAIDKAVPKENSPVELLWRHSVATAIASSVLAEHTGETEYLAFTAGLLHDFGKIVLVCADRSLYVETLAYAGRSRCPITAAETESFGFDHCEVGARLLTRWHLPPDINDTVRHHHAPDQAKDHQRLAAIVSLADLLAHGTGEKFAQEPQGIHPAHPALAILKLSLDTIRALLPEMQHRLEKARYFHES